MKGKRNYIFWLNDQTEYDKNNPLSSLTNITLAQAANFANFLLKTNPRANKIYYMAEKGYIIRMLERIINK